MRLALFLLTFASWASAASLSIERAQVERFEDGSPVFAPDTFTGGETVFFSFRVEGFIRKADTVKLSFEGLVTDPASTLVIPRVFGEETNKLTPEDKNWQAKLRGSFTLPPVLSAGSYRIALRAKDENSGETAAREITFLVSGFRLEPASKLEIRHLNFYRNEEEERPLDVAAYRITEEIHSRFQVVGFHHGDQGAIDVTYGISLADASGHVLFAEPAAAADKSAEFYPKPYVPGLLSFHLKPGTPPGEFMLTVTATDALGAQTAEAHRSFRLE